MTHPAHRVSSDTASPERASPDSAPVTAGARTGRDRCRNFPLPARRGLPASAGRALGGVADERVGAPRTAGTAVRNDQGAACRTSRRRWNATWARAAPRPRPPRSGRCRARFAMPADIWRAGCSPQRVPTPPTLAGARSEIRSEALGTVLILSPWNYPFYLTLGPLIPALAAGNSAVLKVSEKAPAHRARHSHADRVGVSAERGGGGGGRARRGERPARSALRSFLLHGRQAKVGRLVMEAAARHGAGVTLELGGKSPAIVTRSADLRLAARRIAWAKFLNAGQTCVAPDYVLVPQELEERFLLEVDDAVQHYFGGASWQRQGPDYGRMIDAAAVERMRALTETSVTGWGTAGHRGRVRRAAPLRLAHGAGRGARRHARDGRRTLRPGAAGAAVSPPRRRAARDSASGKAAGTVPVRAGSGRSPHEVQARTSSGSMVVNGAIIQLTNPHLPFGGVGASGHGSYHGVHGFRTFSHQRAVMYEPALSPVALILPPYGRPAARLTSWALRKLGS